MTSITSEVASFQPTFSRVPRKGSKPQTIRLLHEQQSRASGTRRGSWKRAVATIKRRGRGTQKADGSDGGCRWRPSPEMGCWLSSPMTRVANWKRLCFSSGCPKRHFSSSRGCARRRRAGACRVRRSFMSDEARIDHFHLAPPRGKFARSSPPRPAATLSPSAAR